MDHRPPLGARGERAARRHLQRRGWRVLAANARVAGVELDLVVCRAGVLVAVEVKTRSADSPLPLLGRGQLARIARALDAVAARHPELSGHAFRIDLLVVEPRRLGWRVRHLPDAGSALVEEAEHRVGHRLERPPVQW
jgi:putative endonuclease